jgi:CelD/BcsL family acetyltransferase involved in cellulose biosynthesis
MDFVRPDARPFVVVVKDNAGQMLGLAPLCRVTHRDHWLPMSGVGFGGREVVSGDYLDYLAKPHARAAVLSGILELLLKRSAEWDLLVIGEVLEGGDLHRALESFAREKRFPIRIQEARSCPYIELPSTFEQYLSAGFSQKRRKELKRQTRVILEDFSAEMEVYTGSGSILENLGTLIELHTGRWQSAKQSGNMGRPGFVRFLHHVCAKPPADAVPLLYVLRHERKPVAALLVFYFGQSALAYSIGRDPNCPISHLSPGLAVLVRSIQDAIQAGCRYYDFLRGDETFKLHLTKTARKTLTVVVGRSLVAKTYLRAMHLKDFLKLRFPGWWARLAGPATPQPMPARAEEGGGAPAGVAPNTEPHATL